MNEEPQEERSLARLKADIELSFSDGRPVYGEGNPDAALAVVGEAPGRDEEITGHPFAGKAGRLLDELFCASGLDRGDLWLTNLVKVRPIRIEAERRKSRTPSSSEIVPWTGFILRELEIISPRIILCLGNLPARALIGPGFRMSRDHGQWHRSPAGWMMTATFHPAYVVRWGGRRGRLWDVTLADFRKARAMCA